MQRAATSPGRALIVAAVVFVGAVLAAELWFRESALGGALSLESGYTAKARELSDDARDIDVAIMGDSRILHGVDPVVIETAVRAELGKPLRVYNAGLAGAPPMGQLALVRRLLTRDEPPRLVVLSISPYMFSSRIVAAMARESLSAIWRVRDLPTALRAGASAEDLAVIASCDLFWLYRYRPRLLDVLLRKGAPGGPAPTGVQGFLVLGDVDPATQDANARARGVAYRSEMWMPDARFENEHMGYFVEALRSLQAAGIRTLVLNSPSASQIDLAYGPNSIYDQHIAWTREQVATYGATWADVKSSPAISDSDYVDGDHMSGNGAARFSAWLAHEHLIPALDGRPADRPAGCKPLFDLDGQGLDGFTREGTAFADVVRHQARRYQQPIFGYAGSRFVSTFGAGGDGDMGEALSPPFALEGKTLHVRIAGGSMESQSLTLLVEGQEVATLRGQNDETLRDATIDIAAYRGKSAQLRVRDRGQGPWEHLNIDDIASCP